MLYYSPKSHRHLLFILKIALKDKMMNATNKKSLALSYEYNGKVF